jgi:hypothetical protein
MNTLIVIVFVYYVTAIWLCQIRKSSKKGKFVVSILVHQFKQDLGNMFETFGIKQCCIIEAGSQAGYRPCQTVVEHFFSHLHHPAPEAGVLQGLL